MVPFNFTTILPGLAVGSMPEPDCTVRDAGFDTLVLTAEDYQPPAEDFCGINVFRIFLDDQRASVPTLQDYADAEKLAARLADRIRRGSNTLITCVEGRNRSTFLTSLVMHRLTGQDGEFIYDWIKACRPHVPGRPERPTFSNQHFKAYVLAKRKLRRR